MKSIIFFILLVSISSIGFITDSSIIPHGVDKFDSTMVIRLYHGGGMAYESDEAWIRFDSCVYNRMDHGKDLRKARVMTVEMRQQVLTILNQHNFYHIHQDNKSSFAHDKATTEICLEQKNRPKFCRSSGASTEIRETDAANFSGLYSKLLEFAKGADKK